MSRLSAFLRKTRSKDCNQELLGFHRELEKNHRELFGFHRELEAAYRRAENEIYRLKQDAYRVRTLQALAAANLFLLDDLIIEAPFPPVSEEVRTALSQESYESVELYFARNLVGPGDTVLDLGSGLGVISIVAAKAAQGGRVVGFEADERVFALAQKNAARNGVNIEYRNGAVSKEAGTLSFNISDNFLANSLSEIQGSSKVTVPSFAFRDIVQEIKPTVITCDIEGAEAEIFENVDMPSVKRLIVETHEGITGKAGIERCVEHLKKSGFQKVESLCWESVFVFDRDGRSASINPFKITPRGAPLGPYVDTSALLDIPDPRVFDSPQSFNREKRVARSAPIVWYIPNWLYWWGGGIYTILRFAGMISKRGVETILYVYDNRGTPPVAQLRSDLDHAHPGHKMRLTTDITSLPEGHIAIASTHQSAYSVMRAPRSAERFYFMQDYESLLYPGGTYAEQANASYKMGFKGICGGDWLRSIFQSYGGSAVKFDFAVDHSVFYPVGKVREQVTRLFFFGRPSSDRRMYELGVAVCQKIKEKYPEVEIVIAGLDALAPLPFPATYLGNLKIEETGDLYRTIDVGLTFSGTNLSYLPLELMASGVPVLTNSGPQVSWVCRHLENCYAAQPMVSDFVRGFEMLYASRSLRQRLADEGVRSVSQATWEGEAEKILTHISKEVGWS
jgi:FkbM family methyltransferase